MPDSITIKGQTYRVGDVLENYEQAAKLIDAWLAYGSKIGDWHVVERFLRDGSVERFFRDSQDLGLKIPLWYMTGAGARRGDINTVCPHWSDYPIKILELPPDLALPPAPKPKPVADWFNRFWVGGEEIWFCRGACVEVYRRGNNDFRDGLHLKDLTHFFESGVKFYATEADCRAVQGLD